MARNEEKRRTIGPEYREVSKGWRTAGKADPQQEWLECIQETWSDMRSLSLRQAMAAHEELPNSRRFPRWMLMGVVSPLLALRESSHVW